MRVDRDGTVGVVTIQNHAFLNSEDDVSTSALEVAVDLVLLDDSIEVGVLRGAPATHPKHAGRRIFGRASTSPTCTTARSRSSSS